MEIALAHHVESTQMTPKEILIAARAKIAKPENWTQEALAREKQGGMPVASTSPDATCWCATGAINAIVPRTTPDRRTAKMLLHKVMARPITSYNDDHEHAEVLAKFDEAIARCDG